MIWGTAYQTFRIKINMVMNAKTWNAKNAATKSVFDKKQKG